MATPSGCFHVINVAQNLDYFYTQFQSAQKAKEYMKSHKFRKGDYLLRPSISNREQLTISVALGHREVAHFNVKYCCDGFYLAEEKKFSTLESLLVHYAHNDVSNTQKISGVRLSNPVRRRSRNQSVPSFCSITYPQTMPYVQDNVRNTCTENGAAGMSPKRRSYSLPTITPRSGIGDSRGLRADPHWLLNRPLPEVPVNGTVGEDLPPSYSQLRQFDEHTAEREASIDIPPSNNLCDCGLRADIGELPLGWSVHLCPPDSTRQSSCLFFQNSAEQTTWVLPENVVAELTVSQREHLRQLSRSYAHAKENNCFD